MAVDVLVPKDVVTKVDVVIVADVVVVVFGGDFDDV